MEWDVKEISPIWELFIWPFLFKMRILLFKMGYMWICFIVDKKEISNRRKVLMETYQKNLRMVDSTKSNRTTPSTIGQEGKKDTCWCIKFVKHFAKKKKEEIITDSFCFPITSKQDDLLIVRKRNSFWMTILRVENVKLQDRRK